MITLKLEVKEVEDLIGRLSKYPYGEVSVLIAKIGSQAQSQIQPIEPETLPG